MNDGGPAFAMPGFCVPGNPDKHATWSHGHGGMSLRDWFAGMVVQGMMAEPRDDDWKNHEGVVAQSAYEMADAMLEHGAKTGETRENEGQGTAIQARKKRYEQ